MQIIPPTKIFISKSPIHGYGIFAKETIKQGELIEECPIFDLNIQYGQMSPLFLDYRFNWPQGTHEWNKQVLAWGYGSLYNHSNEPNAQWKSNLEKETFEFFALKEINPNEEILVYYGDVSYWLDGRTHVEVQ